MLVNTIPVILLRLFVPEICDSSMHLILFLNNMTLHRVKQEEHSMWWSFEQKTVQMCFRPLFDFGQVQVKLAK